MKVSRWSLAQLLARRYAEVGADDKTKRRLSRAVAAYLLSENRVDELDSLLRDMAQIRIDQAGIVEAEAVSAFGLNDRLRQAIKARLAVVFPAAKRIDIDERLDSGTIGGVRLELPNHQLDLTVRAKLNRFKHLTTSGD